MFEIKLKGLVNSINGTGKGVMTTQIRIEDLLNIYKIDNEINRDINYSRLSNLAKYIDSYDSGPGIFMPSLVFSFSEALSNYDVNNNQLIIQDGAKLKVIDGQHRIKGIEYLLKVMKDKERKEFILNSTLTCQIYFGLKEKDEKSVFVDINSHAVRVSMSLVTKYDTRDILRVLTKDIALVCQPLQNAGVEFEKSRIVRPSNTKFWTSARLKNFITYLLFGKINSTNKNDELVKKNYDNILIFLDKFFTLFFEVLPSNPGDAKKFTVGHEALQNALALFLHKEIILECDNDFQLIEDWEYEIEKLKDFEWTVHNPLFLSNMITSRKNTASEFKVFIDTKHNLLLEILNNEYS